MKQPIATLTSSAHVAAGVLILTNARDPFDIGVGAAMGLLGLFSATYHATLNSRADAAEELAMYAMLLALAAAHTNAILLNFFAPFVAAFTLFTFLLMTVERRHADSFIAVPVLVAICLMLGAARYGHTLALLCFAALALSIVLRQVGVAASLRGHKRAGDWLHGMYHLVNASALYYLWHG